MLPADDQIAFRRVVSMVLEVTGPEFELDSYALPSFVVAIHKALRLAVGKRGVNSFDEEAEFTADHAEEKDNPLLVYRSVAQSAKVDRGAVLRSVALCPDRSRFRRGGLGVVRWRSYWLARFTKFAQQRGPWLVLLEPCPVPLQYALSAAEGRRLRSARDC